MTTKLTYFNITGLGEPVRLMLAAANIKFEDIRVTYDEWIKLKPSLTWPHLPCLEIDGMTLFQSRAICRYIARKAGMVGSDKDAALADVIVDCLDDMRAKVVSIYYTPDSPKRTEGLKDAAENVVPFYLNNLEKHVTNGYLVGGKLSWADVMLLAYLDYMNHALDQDNLAKYPKLKAIEERVKQLSGVKEYLASRPATIKDYRQAFPSST